MDLRSVGKIKSSAPLFLCGNTGKVKFLAVKIYLCQSREIKFPTSEIYLLYRRPLRECGGGFTLLGSVGKF
mgnify:CR=1 FL=1